MVGGHKISEMFLQQATMVGVFFVSPPNTHVGQFGDSHPISPGFPPFVSTVFSSLLSFKQPSMVGGHKFFKMLVCKEAELLYSFLVSTYFYSLSFLNGSRLFKD